MIRPAHRPAVCARHARSSATSFVFAMALACGGASGTRAGARSGPRAGHGGGATQALGDTSHTDTTTGADDLPSARSGATSALDDEESDRLGAAPAADPDAPRVPGDDKGAAQSADEAASEPTMEHANASADGPAPDSSGVPTGDTTSTRTPATTVTVEDLGDDPVLTAMLTPDFPASRTLFSQAILDALVSGKIARLDAWTVAASPTLRTWCGELDVAEAAERRARARHCAKALSGKELVAAAVDGADPTAELVTCNPPLERRERMRIRVDLKVGDRREVWLVDVLGVLARDDHLVGFDGRLKCSKLEPGAATPP